ncbi:TonB-dependent receptor plug domain-containing protein [Sandaracinus amylolyticus]|uniref:TonB-dependent receptor plug domain-containing protein n=1 Tax=Sandaracinus amylolyticus TaxID=927083 RepID=UPI001F2307AD|nr:TonB-dependent receptor plug domain-containing protein [Sandaracinus amylolyticus]UJR86663.1 Hypothetical protein I5071_87640 [Sandaracinus amylolyticus]
MRRARCLVILALALAPVVAHAQERDDEVEEIELEDLLTDDVVVRAPTEAEELAESSDSVQVVETDEVRTRAADMGDALARTAGITVRRAGGLGSFGRICLHGMCDSAVRMFVDGVPYQLVGFGSGTVNVPVHLVERIEIYRGTVPLRFGADALGGAINLVRPSYFRSHASVSLQTGSWGTYRLSADAGFRHDDTGFYAGAQLHYDHADNDYWIDVDVPDSRGRLQPARVRRFHDGYESYGVSLETGFVGVPFADRLTIRGFVGEYDRDLQHNIVMSVPYGDVVYGEVSAGALARYEHTITDEVRIDAYVGYTRRDITFLDASSWVYDWRGRRVRERRVAGEIESRPRDQTIWEDALPARLNLAWQITPEHSIHLNATPRYVSRSGDERIESNPGGRDPLTARRELFTMVSGLSYEVSAFDDLLENQVFFKDYVYLASSEEVLPGNTFVDRRRETHDVGFGDGVRVRIVDGLFARGSYEYATRLPEPYEVFGDGVQIVHNLQLAPERSHNGTVELSLDLERTPIGAILASAAGFLRWHQDTIILLGNERTFSYQNVYEALSAGAEANVRWESPGEWVALGANATFLDHRNTSSEGTFSSFRGDRMPNRPWVWANFSAQLRVQDLFGDDELTLTWDARYVHEFFRGWESQGRRDLKQTVPSQFSQDLALTYRVMGAPRIATTIELTNLTDERLYDLFGVQRPGRSIYLKLVVDY